MATYLTVMATTTLLLYSEDSVLMYESTTDALEFGPTLLAPSHSSDDIGYDTGYEI